MGDDSGIIRTVKDREHPYKLINRTFAEDTRLSWEARGLLAYLLVKPDDWETRFKDLEKQAPNCRRDKLRRILREVEDAGYLVRTRVNKAHGRFEWISSVHEVPQAAPDQSTIDGKPVDGQKRSRKRNPPSTGFPSTETPSTENPSIYMNSNRTKYEGDERGGASSRALPPPPSEAPAEVPPVRPIRTTDPNQSHAGCIIYKELTEYRPSKVNAALIASAVQDLALWRRVVHDWMARGFRFNNVDGMLEWYHNGGPTDGRRQHATHRSQRSANYSDALDDWELQQLERAGREDDG